MKKKKEEDENIQNASACSGTLYQGKISKSL
jgi:hypothetical protein